MQAAAVLVVNTQSRNIYYFKPFGISMAKHGLESFVIYVHPRQIRLMETVRRRVPWAARSTTAFVDDLEMFEWRIQAFLNVKRHIDYRLCLSC